MTALAADRRTVTRSGERLSLLVKGSTKIFAGSIVSLGSDGYAVPGRATLTDIVIGIAEMQVDNLTGAGGDLAVEVDTKIVGCFGNSASTDAIALTERGRAVFLVDDQTVAKTSNSGARPVAGTVVDVDASGVWVAFGAALKTASGQATTVAASDTIVTGLSRVLSAVANLEDAPVIGCDRAQAALGDQAGAPAAGSILLKTFKPTASGDATPIAATTFGKKANWIAVGI